MVCETDDFIFCYDIKLQQRRWIMKLTHTQGHMSVSDRDLLQCVRTWQPADPDIYRIQCRVLHADLDCVARAVRFLLG